MIGTFKTTIQNLNRQLESYHEILNDKLLTSKCGTPFCNGKGHKNGTSATHSNQKSCPNVENKPYINMISNLHNQLRNLQKHNIHLTKENLDLSRNNEIKKQTLSTLYKEISDLKDKSI